MSQPVFLDGALWVAIGVSGALQITFKSDSVYKYVDPTVVFWIQVALDMVFSSATSLKMYRSTAYAKHLQDNPTPPMTDKPPGPLT